MPEKIGDRARAHTNMQFGGIGAGGPRRRSARAPRPRSPWTVWTSRASRSSRAWRWICGEMIFGENVWEIAHSQLPMAMQHGPHFSMQRERPRPRRPTRPYSGAARAESTRRIHRIRRAIHVCFILQSHRAPPRSHGPSQVPTTWVSGPQATGLAPATCLRMASYSPSVCTSCSVSRYSCSACQHVWSR